LKESIAILGSTGSIGTQALEIIGNRTQRFDVSALSANNNFQLLAKQANQFLPDHLILVNEENRVEFEKLLTYKPQEISYGSRALETYAQQGDFDLVLNSLVGFAGFMSTYNALKRDKKVALANKESLVVGGHLISETAAFKNGKLIPVDSEHSAMLQCLIGENWGDIKKIIITASGGPFRNLSSDQMRDITVEDALKHPNWSMGDKITIDSSTMMNKGLEIIEAKWLFDIDVDIIEPVIHPQSVIHSIIEFIDGSSKAQLGPPDMKVPILYALTYPNRIEYPNKTIDYRESFNLEFAPVDYMKFPCIKLAIDAAKEGGYAPAILNAANEIAVNRFLKKEIRYIEIATIIEKSLETIERDKVLDPHALLEIDKVTRNYANTLLR
jgi:1-deoxy-D-xylulose-5-phosphate reductoisomerase